MISVGATQQSRNSNRLGAKEPDHGEPSALLLVLCGAILEALQTQVFRNPSIDFAGHYRLEPAKLKTSLSQNTHFGA